MISVFYTHWRELSCGLGTQSNTLGHIYDPQYALAAYEGCS